MGRRIFLHPCSKGVHLLLCFQFCEGDLIKRNAALESQPLKEFRPVIQAHCSVKADLTSYRRLIALNDTEQILDMAVSRCNPEAELVRTASYGAAGGNQIVECSYLRLMNLNVAIRAIDGYVIGRVQPRHM